MKLGELFRSEVVTVERDETVRQATQKMKNKNVGAVVVVEDNDVVGILTDRDVALKVVAGDVSTESPVSDVMTKDVVTIWDDEGVFNATQYLSGRKFRRLPIVEREGTLGTGKLVGILTADDLIAMLARELINVAHALEPALGERV